MAGARKNKQTNRQERQTDRKTDRQTKQRDRQTDKQRDRQTEGKTNRKTNSLLGNKEMTRICTLTKCNRYESSGQYLYVRSTCLCFFFWRYDIPRCVWAWISWKCNRQTTLPLLTQQEWHHTNEIPRKASNDGTSPDNKQIVHELHSSHKPHGKKLSEKAQKGAKLTVSLFSYYIDPTHYGLQVLLTLLLPAFRTSSLSHSKYKGMYTFYSKLLAD